jgi:hypothetical protein
MTGGVISNHYGNGVMVNRGIFNMENGEISGNSRNVGGGVYVYYNSRFNMSGGKISGNKASSGAGVEVSMNSTFIMSGGEISGNFTIYDSSTGFYQGTGVSIDAFNCVFIKTGGTIYGIQVATRTAMS